MEITLTFKARPKDEAQRFIPPSPSAPKVRHHEYCKSLIAQRSLTFEDEDYLFDLLLNHPDAKQKVGCGVDSIYIGPTPFGTYGFFLERVDGTSDNFSYKRCIDGRPPLRAEVINALRHVVADDMSEFKRTNFNGRCEKTGRPLAFDDAEVHHAGVLFVEIADRFADICGGYKAIPLRPKRDDDYGRVIRADYAERFRAYHTRRARLMIVSRRMNRAMYWEHMEKYELAKEDEQ
jgi:Protein of unknown function (DUF3223)